MDDITEEYHEVIEFSGASLNDLVKRAEPEIILSGRDALYVVCNRPNL